MPVTRTLEDNKGMISQTAGSPAIKEAWAKCAELNAAETDPARGQWVPWRSIQIDDAILPRENLSPDAIKAYAVDFEAMPPLRVQKGTLRLIGGRHRLEAVSEVGTDFIRVIEVDVPDDDLWMESYADNRTNGVQMTLKEKTHAARRLLLEKPDWSNQKISTWAGIHVNTVGNWRREEEAKKQAAIERKAEAERAAVATLEKVTDDIISDAPADFVPAAEAPAAEGSVEYFPTPPAAAVAPEPAPEVTPPTPQRRIGVDGKTHTIAPQPSRKVVSREEYLHRQAIGLLIPVPAIPEDEPHLLAGVLAESEIEAKLAYLRQVIAELDTVSEWASLFVEAAEARVTEFRERAAGEAVPV